jgi:hypothetical protein
MLDNRNTISCTLAAKWTDIALPHSRAYFCAPCCLLIYRTAFAAELEQPFRSFEAGRPGDMGNASGGAEWRLPEMSLRSCHGIQEQSNRAGKVAYESRRDYIIAVKGKMRHRVTLSTQSESAAFRRISLISSSGDLWCGVVHDGVSSPQFFL